MSESIRTFVAIELPPTVQRGLAQVQERLKRGGHPVRWVAPGNIHVTLSFLGEITRAQLEAVGEAVTRVAAASRPFLLEALGCGVFPNPRRPRVVWVGIQGELEPLGALHGHLERALAELGFPPEGRSFSPHLTVGRTQRRCSPAQARALGDAVSAITVPSLGRWEVEEIVVMRSDLRPEGPLYTRQRTAPLAG